MIRRAPPVMHHDDQVLAAEKIRLLMALRRSGITDTRVLAAMEHTPREVFVSEAQRHHAYDDSALPIARDLNEGRIRPSELPFLLSGLDSPSTPIRRYTLPPSPAAPTRAAETLALAPSHHIHEAEPHGAVSTLTPARVLH